MSQIYAVFHERRWQWRVAPIDAQHEICPACHRQEDNAPAGYVTLDGPFLTEHHDEILRLIYNKEEHERAEHPFKRIMAVEKQGDSLLVTTTDIHLARGIGEAVHHAYQGDLELHYNAGENLFHANWRR